jgi:hypothetical protein
LQIAKAEFKRLESAGIVHRSKSPWASPLHLVPKKDGSWWPCGDNRRLNLVTTPDEYPLPNLQDLSNGLQGCTIFSKIDLVKGYHRIPVATKDVPKIAIITPFVLFEYLFTPFGLRTNISKNDGSHHRWSGRCVCIYGRLMCQFSRQANTPLPSGGFFLQRYLSMA